MDCEQQFSLSWNNFHGNVSRELSVLFGSETLADVTLAVGGELLQAHRLVLAICSPYFKKMFQMNPHHHPIVVLRDVSLKAMRDLLQFMYHGEVSIKREDLTGFIATAELLQIKGLTNKEGIEEDSPAETPKHQTNTLQNRSSESEPINNETPKQTEKRKLLDDKTQKLNQLKRTSEHFLQNYYQNEQSEKKRCTESSINHSNCQNSHYYEESSSLSYTERRSGNECDGALNLKTECDESDIVVTDPALTEMNKSLHEDSSDLICKDMQVPNEDAGGLRSIFMDLKSIVNGKFGSRVGNFEVLNGDHHLTTIPQKMDGKKKYPQRSCRACGKLGKRKDTRFMCGYCAIPFCKYPCFDLHVKMAVEKTDDDFAALPY